MTNRDLPTWTLQTPNPLKMFPRLKNWFLELIGFKIMMDDERIKSVAIIGAGAAGKCSPR
jgi:hypothetical protein